MKVRVLDYLDNRTEREAGEALVCQCVFEKQVVVDGHYWNISTPGEKPSSYYDNVVRIKCDPGTARSFEYEYGGFVMRNGVSRSTSQTTQMRPCGSQVPESVIVEIGWQEIEDIIDFLKFKMNEED